MPDLSVTSQGNCVDEVCAAAATTSTLVTIIEPPSTAGGVVVDDTTSDSTTTATTTQATPVMMVLKLLHRLDRVLRRIRGRLDEMMVVPPTPQQQQQSLSKNNEHNGSSSVRHIQGSRYEIFVRASFKPTTAFDWICAQILQEQHDGDDDDGDRCRLYYSSPADVKEAILNYAEQQARRDPRMGGTVKDDDFVFDNFSLLVNYDSVEAQHPHVDLLDPNRQFGLMVTHQSPATLVYETDYTIRTVDDLQKAWPDLPDSIATAMHHNQQTSALLHQFGDLLCPNIQPVVVPPHHHNPCNTTTTTTTTTSLLSTGTVLSLPGSVIHAGPACSSFRAVLFFTSWPKGSPAAPYHPDTQYFAPLLCADIVTLLWDELSTVDRVYLLTQLADSIHAHNCPHLYRHLSDRHIIAFTRGLTSKKQSQSRRSYICRFARNRQVQGSILGFADEKGRPMKKVSVDKLVTEWEGELYAIQVYQSVGDQDNNNNNGVLIYYPSDHTLEGGGKRQYTLEMAVDNDPTHRSRPRRGPSLFDGSNGTLRDDDGHVIICHDTSAKQQRKAKRSRDLSTRTPA